MFGEVGIYPPASDNLINQIFVSNKKLQNKVRFINAFKTNIPNVEKMYVLDGFCHVFSLQTIQGESEKKVVWYRFDASDSNMIRQLERKQSSPDF